jgi:hypothetical protein
MDVGAGVVAPLASLLAPALPYLLNIGNAAASEAGKAIGAEAWTRASCAWRKLQPAVSQRPAAREAAEDLAHNTNDPDALAAFRQQLRKVLSDEPQLIEELKPLLESNQTTTTVIASGDGAIAAGRDNRGMILSFRWLTDLWRRG